MPGVSIDPRVARARAIQALLAAQQAATPVATPLNTPINPVAPPRSAIDNQGYGMGAFGPQAGLPSYLPNPAATSSPAFNQPPNAQGSPGYLGSTGATPPQSPQLPPPPFMGANPYAGPPGYLGSTSAATATPAPAADDNTDNTDSADTSDTTSSTNKSNTFNATGKTDTFGSWFNKRSSSDALTAFGAAMLKAPTFLQGLGDGALAVNAVDRQNRMPTPEEIARANITDYNADGTGGDGAASQRGQTTKIGASGFDANHKFWQNSFDQGKQVWTSEDGTIQNHPPIGFVPSTQSGVGQFNKINSHDYQEAEKRVTQSYTNVGNYKDMLKRVDSAGVGADLSTKMERLWVTTTGFDNSDMNNEDIAMFKKYAANTELEAAFSQRGLGQLTEGEREIIRASLPEVNANPKAAKAILRVMIAREQRMQMSLDDYDAGDQKVPFNKFVRVWNRDYNDKHGDSNTQGEAAAAAASAPTSKSILDEADAIVK